MGNELHPYMVICVGGGFPQQASTMKEARELAYRLAEINGRKAIIFMASEECVVNAVSYKPIRVAA